MKKVRALVCCLYLFDTYAMNFELVPLTDKTTIQENHTPTVAHLAQKADMTSHQLCGASAICGCCKPDVYAHQTALSKYAEAINGLYSGQKPIEWPTCDNNFTLTIIDQSHKKLKACMRIQPYGNHNEIETFLSKMPYYPLHITKINLSHNNLQDIPLVTLTHTCENLEEFDASYNSISYVLLYYYQTSDTPYQHKKLHTLNLSNNELSQFDLARCVHLYPYLKSINLAHNPLSKLDFEYIADIACTLNLSHTDIPLNTQEEYIARYISNTQQKKVYTPMIVRALMTSLMTFITTGLTLSNTSIDPLTTIGISSIAGLGSYGIVSSLYYCLHRYTLKEIEQQGATLMGNDEERTQ